MSTTLDKLRTEIDRFIDAEDMAALEKFLIERFKDLPEEMQSQVLLGFYTEAIEKQAGEAGIAKLQEEGIDALDKIAALKTALEAPGS